MILVIAVGSALLAGFLAGFVCFKKTNEFCGRCGVTRQCPVCPAPPAPTPTRIPWNMKLPAPAVGAGAGSR